MRTFRIKGAIQSAPSGTGRILPPGNLAVEPGTGISPIALGRSLGQVQRRRRLFKRQASEVSQLHQFGLARVVVRQRSQAS